MLKYQEQNSELTLQQGLEEFYSITSWIGTLAGLTIMFTGVLETFTFSPLNSFIASFLLALITGLPMWGVVKSLLVEVESGTIKPIEPGQF